MSIFALCSIRITVNCCVRCVRHSSVAMRLLNAVTDGGNVSYDSHIRSDGQQPGEDGSQRRMTHNMVEKRRKDKIKQWISHIAQLLPPSTNTGPDNRLVRYWRWLLALSSSRLVELLVAPVNVSGLPLGFVASSCCCGASSHGSHPRDYR